MEMKRPVRIMPIRRSDDLRNPAFRTSRQAGVQHPDFQNKSSSRNAGCIQEIVLSAVVVIILYALSHACMSCFVCDINKGYRHLTLVWVFCRVFCGPESAPSRYDDAVAVDWLSGTCHRVMLQLLNKVP